MKRLFLVFLLFGIIPACSESDSNKEQGTVFDTQTDAMEKAKEVEKQMEDAAEKQFDAIREQTE
ncbi:MAG TPA: hypothetical protein VLN56_05380 [Gammaproteobacteria bacterium]|nr:hypothetical protein [Gammaproteobacteria bacterium]